MSFNHFRRKLCYEIIKNKCHAILDLGTGNGKLLHELINMKYFPEIFVGIDISLRDLIMASEKFRGYYFSNFIVCDCQILPVRRNFDCITCSFSLAHFENPFKVLDNIREVIKGNGKLLIVDYSHPFYYSEVNSLFRKGPNYIVMTLINYLKKLKGIKRVEYEINGDFFILVINFTS